VLIGFLSKCFRHYNSFIELRFLMFSEWKYMLPGRLPDAPGTRKRICGKLSNVLLRVFVAWQVN